MEFFMQEEIVEPVRNKSVPPAEVVADHQHWPACCVQADVKFNAVKMTLQSILRITAEESYKERGMPCFYLFLMLISTSEFAGSS